MNEQIIIKSERDIRAIAISIAIILIGLVCIIAVFCDGGIEALLDYMTGGGIEIVVSWGGISLIVIGIILLFRFKNCEIVVTDKRIYGKATFGTRVDLPLDSISAVGMSNLFMGIVVASVSECIKFYGIKNNNKIHKEISNLLLDRQNNNKVTNKAIIETKNNADELKKYKELLDMGAITQEEFNIKKKQLLK